MITRAAIDEYIGLMEQLNAARAAYHEIELRAHPGSSTADRGPRSSGNSRKTETLGIKLAEADEILGVSRLERAVAVRRADMVRYISSLPDALTRKVMLHRVLEGLPWKEVASLCGAGVSEDAVQMRFARAVRKLA